MEGTYTQKDTETDKHTHEQIYIRRTHIHGGDVHIKPYMQGSDIHTKEYKYEGTHTRRDIHAGRHTHGKGIHTEGDRYGREYTQRGHNNNKQYLISLINPK